MVIPFTDIFEVAVEPRIVFEDYYLAVVVKPFGYTVEKSQYYPSLEDFFLKHLQTTFPGNKKHFIGIVHRLDVVTAGLVVIAKTPQALKHLNLQFEQHVVVKKYKACIHGVLSPDSGKLDGFIIEDRQTKTATFYGSEVKESKKSSLSYTTLLTENDFSLIEITLHTGRFHQIRASLKFTGNPIAGDEKYGSTIPLENKGILLVAHSLEFIHPKSAERSVYLIP